MKKFIPGIFIFIVLMFAGGSLFSQTADFTSNDEKANTYELTASPNPFENEVTISVNEGNKNVTSIRIHDIIGKEVAYIDLRNKSGMFSYKLDFSSLPAGVYFCNVYGAEGIIETKRLSHTK